MAEHGTITRYNSGKCRCDECRKAINAYLRERRKRKAAALASGKISPNDFEHGVNGYNSYGCRCETCSTAHTQACAAPSKKWAQANKEHIKGRQSETVQAAKRNGYEWTGPELEIASRSDLTAREAALILGRTLYAVGQVRRKLRDDPKTINLAGVHPSVADR